MHLAEQLEIDMELEIVGEVNRTDQGTANLLPIAYGAVRYDGVILNSGTGNWSASWNGTDDRMEISITDENFTTSGYIVNITPINSAVSRTSTISSGNNDMYVYMWTSGGNLDTNGNSFYFTIYKP